MGEKAGDFTVSIFLDRDNESTRIAAYQYQREPSSKGLFCYKKCGEVQEISETDREALNKKISEALKPVLFQLKEDSLWNKKQELPQ